YTGGKAVTLRQQAVPWAYRVFFRQVGIDPDEHRTPVEAIALERMRAGGFPSRNVLDDAMLIATVETSVPVMAFDEDALTGPLGLRLAGADERLGGDGRPRSGPSRRGRGPADAARADRPPGGRARRAVLQHLPADGLRLARSVPRRPAGALPGGARAAPRRAAPAPRAQPPDAQRPHL